MSKRLSRILLDTFYKYLSSMIFRYPDEMIFCIIDGRCAFTVSHALSYQILARLDSHYITSRVSGDLCGPIIIGTLRYLLTGFLPDCHTVFLNQYARNNYYENLRGKE